MIFHDLPSVGKEERRVLAVDLVDGRARLQQSHHLSRLCGPLGVANTLSLVGILRQARTWIWYCSMNNGSRILLPFYFCVKNYKVR